MRESSAEEACPDGPRRLIHAAVTLAERARHVDGPSSGVLHRGDELLTIERVAALHRVGLFRAVPGHALVPVARMLEEVRLEGGVTFIEQDALEDWLFVIVAGRVRVHAGERTLRQVGAGGVVGELAVVAPAPRSASVTTIEPTVMLRLRRKPFEELLDDQPEIARGVIVTLATMLQSDGDHLTDPGLS